MGEPVRTSAEQKTGAQPTQALVLSGGHVRGAYQAGAIAEILKPEYGFRPSAVYGISVGSINGGMLASYVGEQFLRDPNRKEADFAAAGEDVEKFWREKITSHKKIGEKRFPLWVALDVIRHRFHGMLNVDKSIEIIQEEIQPANLREAAKRGLKFFAGTLNLTTNDYLDATLDEDAKRDHPIVDYVIASCMAPIVMPLWVIPSHDNRPFFRRWWENYKEKKASQKPDHEDRDDCWLDGGIYNPVPISSAIEAGYDDIICVLTRPEKLKRGSFQGRLGATAARITDVVTQRLLEEDIKWACDMKAWMGALDECVQQLTPGRLKKYNVNEKFQNYRSFQITVVRPHKLLDYEIETLTEKAVAKMANLGQAHAQAVMSHYRPHVPGALGGPADSNAPDPCRS
jgi:NTE family protein